MVYRRDDIDRVRAATNLVDLVAGVTTVKRQGRAYVAVCPFHQEKSPSLSLDPARGLYHCFGCGKGGDVFTFIQETQGLDFNESLELLARQAGIQLEVDPGAAQQRGERDQMVEAVRHAADFYHRTLKNDVDAGPARAYLRGRGIDVATVDEYRIGFAPEGDTWGALVKELRGAGIKDRTMERPAWSAGGRAVGSTTSSGGGSCSRSTTFVGSRSDSVVGVWKASLPSTSTHPTRGSIRRAGSSMGSTGPRVRSPGPRRRWWSRDTSTSSLATGQESTRPWRPAAPLSVRSISTSSGGSPIGSFLPSTRMPPVARPPSGATS